jgi:hypothetical protein
MARQKPRHHYVPAAFIGRFSADPGSRARESLVWVRNRGVGVPFVEKAENVGHVRGLYDTADAGAVGADEHGVGGEGIDAAWRRLEDRLSPAIDLLLDANGTLDAHVFGEVLVPFVAALFIRGWEFDRRFVKRMDSLVGTDSGLHARFTSRENVNYARLMEMQRLFSPVMQVEMLQRRPVAEPEGIWGVPGGYLARTDVELFDFLVEIAQPPDEMPRIDRDEASAHVN